MKTQVIGCPKTIDGDLKCKDVPISFGFDTACKVFVILLGGILGNPPKSQLNRVIIGKYPDHYADNAGLIFICMIDSYSEYADIF